MGPGRGGWQVVVGTSETSSSVLDMAAVQGMGTPRSKHGKARRTGLLPGRLPEEMPHLQKSKEDQAWASFSLGSYSHPLGCLGSQVLLTQKRDEKWKERPQVLESGRHGFLSCSGFSWLLEPGQVICDSVSSPINWNKNIYVAHSTSDLNIY